MHGNLAYNEVIQQTQDTIIQNQKAAKKKKIIEKRRKEKKFISKTAFICLVIFSSSVFMISRYIELDSTNKMVSSLEKELKEAEAYTSQKSFELEQSVDLMKIEEEATTRLGMQRPEKYQIVYINMKNEDTTDVTANEVEGVKNNILEKVKEFKSNISGIFNFSK